jgi:hypothetical protein
MVRKMRGGRYYYVLLSGAFGVGAKEVGEKAISAAMSISIEVVVSTRRGMATQNVKADLEMLTKIEQKSRDFKFK